MSEIEKPRESVSRDEGSEREAACQNCGRTHWGKSPILVKRVGELLRCPPCVSSYRDGVRHTIERRSKASRSLCTVDKCLQEAAFCAEHADYDLSGAEKRDEAARNSLSELELALPPTPGCQVCNEDEACGYCVVDYMNSRRRAARAAVPRNGDLARLIRRVKSLVPLSELSIEDQEALNHLANIVDCPECRAPYETSGVCGSCGREWGRVKPIDITSVPALRTSRDGARRGPTTIDENRLEELRKFISRCDPKETVIPDDDISMGDIRLLFEEIDRLRLLVESERKRLGDECDRLVLDWSSYCFDIKKRLKKLQK